MSDAASEFASHHGLSFEQWPWGKTLLGSFLAGRDSLEQAMAHVSEQIVNGEPSFGLLNQLSERAAEHIGGAVSCFATKSAASAELAARAAIEVSVNVRFMLDGDRNSRVVAWIRDFVHNDEKQIVQWEKALTHLSEVEKQVCTPRIATRRTLLGVRKGWLESAEIEFAQFGQLNLKEPWPNVAERFRAIGEEVAYRTAYARLSSQTHGDAEDTLNYIFFKLMGDEQLIVQMAEETVAFSQYLIGYSVYYYLIAMKHFCETFKLTEGGGIESSLREVLRAMNEIGDSWNW